MSDFLFFLKRLTNHLNLSISFDTILKNTKDEYELAAFMLYEINKFLYQKNTKLENNYISEFHKYWKKNHEKVLQPIIEKTEAFEVAKILEDIYAHNKIKTQLNTLGLSKKRIANVRFFTAIQDFKTDINAKVNPFELYKIQPDFFKPKKILKNELLIDELLNRIGADSQIDKRKPWMRKAAELLIEKYDGCAFNINKAHNGDVLEIKKSLVDPGKYGFSQKKADMFLRDMVDLGVWEYRKNIDKINVMSDKNTMRIALRTGILQFRIPLLASYMDVYCYQYGLVDRWSAKAWREVWVQWDSIKNNHRPATPASIDYFIYRMGKLACWKSETRRKCPPGNPISNRRLEALVIQDKLIFNERNFCVFERVCKDKNKILKHPMSISIYGRTGWKSGITDEGGGGGIQS
ncbi:MAG: hypothetical protein K9L87_03255 [Candidatus Omnitrophica bacterium]|nr:hypothetical protein [Candidatus Omnitrophota bacterium]MCF7909788.1 hypothetical protein [Candidatus Omnitrophota bacterium]